VLNPANANATSDTACSTSNPPNELVLAGGTPQTAQLNAAFAAPLQVMLANANGCPTGAVGTPITFTAPSTGASGSFGTSGSNNLTVGADSQGAAQAGSFVANDTAGTYTVQASSAYGKVSFELTNSSAGLPTRITPLHPPNQSARVNNRYREPLSVRITDADGAPVVGAPVTFSIGHASAGVGGDGAAPAGASFTGDQPQATEMTNSAGIATSPSLTANDTAGTFTAVASIAHLTQDASFRLRNLAETLMLRRLGDRQPKATVDTRYQHPLQVRVTGANNKPVTGVTVTFTLAAAAAVGGAAMFATGSTQATETTAADGIATSPRFSANSIAGTFPAIVTLQGTSQTTRFWPHNHAAVAATVAAGVGAVQSASTGARFAIPLAVTVTDAHGNPVPHASVTFTAPATGPSGSFHGLRRVTIRTDTRGIAVAPHFIANHTPGGYVVNATTGHARTAAFALVNQQP
jgi:hypothetical protein